MATTSSRIEQAIEGVLARLATPTDDIPCAATLSDATLRRVAVAVARDLPGGPPLSGADVVRAMCRLRVAQRLPLRARRGERAPTVYALGAPPGTPSPAEVLTAIDPQGVLVYFTAIELHGLSTQAAPFHHIARTTRHVERPVLAREPRRRRARTGDREFDPLGTRICTYRGTPLYRTQRDERWLVASQRRHMGDRVLVRVTTIEQTLIDTLHQPRRCGGPAVVREAWESALRDFDAGRIHEILRAIDDPVLDRRVGLVLDRSAGSVGGPLGDRLSAARRAAAGAESAELFRGYPGRRIDSTWNLAEP